MRVVYCHTKLKSFYFNFLVCLNVCRFLLIPLISINRKGVNRNNVNANEWYEQITEMCTLQMNPASGTVKCYLNRLFTNVQNFCQLTLSHESRKVLMSRGKLNFKLHYLKFYDLNYHPAKFSPVSILSAIAAHGY